MPYRLQDLINIDLFQDLQDRLNEIYSFPSAIIDNDGNILTATAWQEICTDFHRKHPLCLPACVASDKYIIEHLDEADPAVTYRCPHGLVDNATPIIIGGVHYGNFFTGQFFLEPPDLDFFRRQAARYGFDEDAYLAAVAKVPVWNEEQLSSYLFFIKGLIAVICESALKRLEEIEMRTSMEESEERYRKLLESIPDIIMRFDRDGRHLFVSESVSEAVDMRPEDFFGKTHRELGFSPEQSRFWEEAIAQVFESGKPIETGFEIEGPSGPIIYNWRVVPELDDGGEVRTVLTIARDITEKRKIERDYELLFNEMLDGFAMHEIICDDSGVPVDYRFVAVNPAFERMTGLVRADIVGKTVLEVMPRTEAVWIETYGKVALSGEPATFESYSAEIGKHFEVTAVRNAPGRFTCIFADVTERKLADKALRESEANLRMAQRVSHVGNWVWHIRENRVEWSDEMYRIWGVDENTFSGDLPEIIERSIHPDDRASVEASNRSVVDKNKPLPLQYRVIRPDGSVRTVWAEAGETVFDDDGIPLALAGIVQDITDRVEAEQQIRETSMRLSESVRAANVGLWEWDLATDRVNYSTEWKRQIGYDDGEIGDDFEEWRSRVHPDDIGPAMAKVEAALSDGRSRYQLEFRLRHKDGSYRWILVQSSIYRDESGRPYRVLGSHVDITDRKRTEEEHSHLQARLLQAQKLESVGRLAGGVAHDFNNMLSVIIGNAEMALSRLGESDPLRDELEEIRKAADRSAELTRQLLAFARKQTASPRVIVLNETVDNALKMLIRLIGEEIRLEWRPGESLWPVRIDPIQIDQILTNLCVNARDAIRDGGTVAIETGNITIDAGFAGRHADVESGDYVLVTVSDTGCGMDRETIANIFEPFYTSKAVGAGTGLGLPTVYGIVKQNSGFIEVYSEVGKGSTFRIYFPRHRGAEEKREGLERSSSGGSETILLVEDEPSILRMAKNMLESLGYRVLAAAVPGEAILLAAEYRGRIDLLITDVVMPEMNGRELAKQLLAMHPDLSRLFMSGYTANVIAHHGVLDRGVHFIQKPFTTAAFAEAVRNALRDAADEEVRR